MIEITINEEDLKVIQEKLKKLAVDDRSKAIYRSFRTAALVVESKLKQNVSNRYLSRRSGRLASSIGSLITTEKTGLKATIGSGVRQGGRLPYANILETGGKITPKNGSALTIPLPAAKTAAGAPRFTASQVKQGATKYTSSFVSKGVIFGIVGKKGKPVPLFVLKTSVTIPAKYWMSKTAEESSQDVVKTILNTIDEELKA